MTKATLLDLTGIKIHTFKKKWLSLLVKLKDMDNSNLHNEKTEDQYRLESLFFYCDDPKTLNVCKFFFSLKNKLIYYIFFANRKNLKN